MKPMLLLLLVLGCGIDFARGQTTFSDVSNQSTNGEIEQRLDQKRDMMFNDATLEDVEAFLELSGIPAHLNVRALDDVGIGTDMPLTFRHPSIRLRDGLDLMLREFDLTWSIRHGRVIITTPEEAERQLITRVYDVRNLVELTPVPYWGGGLGGQTTTAYQYDFDSLIDTIRATVDPTSWDAVGGPGSIRPYYTRRMKVIVVSQTYPIHRQIDSLLETLAGFGGKTPLPATPTYLPTAALRTFAAPQYVNPASPKRNIRSSRLRTTGQ